jgi:hypothetical protein
LSYLQVHLGEWVTNATLRDRCELDDVTRCLRSLRADGWPIEVDGKGACRLLPQERTAPRHDGQGVTGQQRQRIFERDGRRCRVCGFGAGEVNRFGEIVRLEVHHRQPRHHGGSSDDANLETLCMRCNHEKQAWWRPSDTSEAFVP